MLEYRWDKRGGIASGEEASLEKGTSFGPLAVGMAWTNTLLLTNNGSALLTFDGLVTNGIEASSFRLLDVPAALAAGTSSEFSVVFDPQYSGTNRASFVFSFDGTNSPYTVNVAGVGLSGGMAFSTNVLSYSGIYSGTNPPTQALVLANVGESSFTWTNAISYSAGASNWLGVLPMSGSVPASGDAVLAISVDISGLGAGTYWSTNTISAADATNSPQGFVVQLLVGKAGQGVITFEPASPQTYHTTNALIAAGGSGTGVLSYSISAGGGNGEIVGGTHLWMKTGTGTVTVRATRAADANYEAAHAEAVVEARKASQEIGFGPLCPQKWTATNALVATATSGLDVDFAVVDGPGMIGEDGTHGTYVAYDAPGDVRVVASQTGSVNYAAAPSITNVVKVFRVMPEHGPMAGGTPATITNGWFGTVTNVMVGPAFGSVSNVQQAEASSVALVMPSATNAGWVDIVVQTEEQGDITLADAYRYNPAGGITHVSPAEGVWTGGYEVVISGTDLSDPGDPPDVTSVTLAGVSVLTIVRHSSTQVVVVAGASSAGAQSGDVVVQFTAFGQTVATDAFRYLKTDQVITFPSIGDKLTTDTVGLVATASSGLPASFEVLSGPAVLENRTNGTYMSYSGAGEVVVRALQVGDERWHAAEPLTNSLMVTRAVAPVTLDGLVQVYDGSPRVVRAQTVPEGLTVEVEYDGLLEAPVGIGVYALSAEIDDLIYQGQASGTLQVLPAAPPQILSALIVRIPWSPHFDQTLEILSDIDSEGLRVIFTDLREGIEVENKTGDTLGGDPMIELYRDIQAGETVAIAVRYVCRGAFMVDHYPPTLAVEYVYPGMEWDSGHHEIGGGWRWLSWFGFYVPLDSNWIWHDEHAFLYARSGATPRAISLFSPDMGWLWTSRARYPYLYRFSDRNWLWYLRDSAQPRWFYNLGSGEWEQQ